ncbi:sugar phosphate isomerase/epimerase family protein [Alteribacillus sp. HJP-4]|uniref:sugar phosphate isomerase/epimerase family protein n=1 Tax=Alteribacillus sp. HJP-4 TaxID=2775394 RepID=UPI0035CD0EC8
MKKGLSPAGIGEIKDVKEYITLASRHGFASIDTDGKSLRNLIESERIDNARSLLEKHQIDIGAIGLDVEWRGSEEQFQSGIAGLAADSEAASALGCQTCMTYILPSTDYLPAQFMAAAVRRLRVCARILGSYGIQLALEFVGPHHLRKNWEHPFIWNLEHTLDFIDAIDEKNTGLLIDAYHCYTNNISNETLASLNPAQIVHVHINDAKDLPVEELLDNDRLYPGEGVIDLEGFLQALKQAGYEGPVAQEILTQHPPKEGPEYLIQKSAAAFDRLFTSAGV